MNPLDLDARKLKLASKISVKSWPTKIRIFLNLICKNPKIVEGTFCDGWNFLDLASWLNVWLTQSIRKKGLKFSKNRIFFKITFTSRWPWSLKLKWNSNVATNFKLSEKLRLFVKNTGLIEIIRFDLVLTFTLEWRNHRTTENLETWVETDPLNNVLAGWNYAHCTCVSF